MKLEPDKYPIDLSLEAIGKDFESSHCLLIKAQTGAGKTTRLPPYLLSRTDGKVLVLEPRRLAAKLSAARCAEILGEDLGKTVGHHIRLDKKISNDTRLIFITEGLFFSYIKESPDLGSFSTIIIDEFHERNIYTDLALSMAKMLQQTKRPDLKIVVMSATLETKRLETYLGTPKVYDIPGRVYPIQIEYHPPAEQGGRRGREHWKLNATRAIVNLAKDQRCPKNILVFLSGMGAIRSLEQSLSGKLSPDIEVLPLHSTLPKSQQDKVFSGGKRKIILSTNIAETSLTIPNITGVVDLGNERRASFAPWSGMPLLQLKNISKASATQRAGRAGRVQEGIVYRLYSEGDHFHFEDFTPPEIKRVELSHSLLDLMELGYHPDMVDWFEAPEEKNLKNAMDLLETLGAVVDGKMTKLGRFIAALPLHPRHAAMLYECSRENLSDTLLGACILSEGSILGKNAHFREEDKEICDLCVQIDLLKAHFTNDKTNDYPVSFLDPKKIKRVLDLYKMISPIIKCPQVSGGKISHRHLTSALLRGFPDRVAAKRKVTKGKKVFHSYNFCLGRGGKLGRTSSIVGSSPEYIIVLDALEDPKANAAVGTTIQSASSISKEALLQTNNSLMASEKQTTFNEKKGTITISTITKYGKLALSENSSLPVIPKGDALVQLIKDNWPWPFETSEELDKYNQRVRILNEAKIEHNCPGLTGEMFDLFLECCIDDETELGEIKESNLKDLIYAQLSPPDIYILDSEAPEIIKLSNSKQFKLHYEEHHPCIYARVQDLYSVNEHPLIASKTLPITIKLLSPAERVTQIVSDLPNFWENSWEAVRKELKSRYPKHHWADDPVSAPPIRILKKSKS